MTEVAGGQNEANKTFAPELFVNLTLFFNHFSCGYETYSICTIEDGEHFGEVELRRTPRLRREMRPTITFQCILSRLTPMIVDYSFMNHSVIQSISVLT